MAVALYQVRIHIVLKKISTSIMNYLIILKMIQNNLVTLKEKVNTIAIVSTITQKLKKKKQNKIIMILEIPIMIIHKWILIKLLLVGEQATKVMRILIIILNKMQQKVTKILLISIQILTVRIEILNTQQLFKKKAQLLKVFQISFIIKITNNNIKKTI